MHTHTHTHTSHHGEHDGKEDAKITMTTAGLGVAIVRQGIFLAWGKKRWG